MTLVNISFHTYESVMLHMWMALVCHCMCHICKWGISHIWTCHFIHMNESCHTCKWHWCASTCVTYVIEAYCTCEHTVLYIWICHVTNVNGMGVPLYVSHMYMRHIHTWTCHFIHMNESWHTCKWHLCAIVCVTYVNEAHDKYEHIISYIWMSHVTHGNSIGVPLLSSPSRRVYYCINT